MAKRLTKKQKQDRDFWSHQPFLTESHLKWNYPTAWADYWLSISHSKARWAKTAKKFAQEAPDIQEAQDAFAERIKHWYTKHMPELDAMWNDLLLRAIDEIDWQAVAKRWVEASKAEKA